MKRKYLTALAVLMVVWLWSAAGVVTVGAQTYTLNEGFEAGGKTSYAAANVTLGSGSWYMDDALTGNSTSDRKTGSWSARVRNVGKVSMNFNVASAGTVSIQHGVFGTDGSSGWELWKSTDGGSTWTKVGSTVTTGSTTLSTASFTVNSASAIRFQVRKVSGGTNRVNIDNIAATAYGTTTSSSVHLTMGNPSNAITDVNKPTNYLMEKAQYALSYHRDNGRPNWVSWHLNSSWLGTTARQDDFRADTTLPAGWYRVQATDYSGSGYDRGHMTPSADRTKTVADNSATFLMTNMIPQAPTNNQQTWANLESYCRTLVNAGNELYIISGGQGTSGYIANGYVAVPTYTWKVIMVLPNGTNDVSRVTTSTRLIAVYIPNNNSVVSDWKQYRVSTDYVESSTGSNFFSNVADSVENTIEAVIDTQ
ncbi:MAG TPA: DNA/RNA non-specific endonuclease [Pyrinomonadaceae bacterium]|nr:DNA/RNA non-specific endonuclease [Pyrinomonadaceae bacterium]